MPRRLLLLAAFVPAHRRGRSERRFEINHFNYKDFPAAATVAEMTKEGRTASL